MKDKPFTDLTITKFKPPKAGQKQYWDTPSKSGGVLGLSVLVSAGFTKTFHGKRVQIHRPRWTWP